MLGMQATRIAKSVLMQRTQPHPITARFGTWKRFGIGKRFNKKLAVLLELSVFQHFAGFLPCLFIINVAGMKFQVDQNKLWKSAFLGPSSSTLISHYDGSVYFLDRHAESWLNSSRNQHTKAPGAAVYSITFLRQMASTSSLV